MKRYARIAGSLLAVVLTLVSPQVRAAGNGYVEGEDTVIAQLDPVTNIVIHRTYRNDNTPRPGILLISGYGVQGAYTRRFADDVAYRAYSGSGSDAGILEQVDLYTLDSPIGSSNTGEGWEGRKQERTWNMTSMDDDRDGLTDEDGPDDLNGDGLITMLRVEDQTGGYIAHPLDARVLIPAMPEKGEAGKYALYVEGLDSDKDERYNEDPFGGVDFNRNFPFDYPYFEPGAGPFPCSEVESKAVADWLWDHPEIVAVVAFGPDDNLRTLWPGGADPGPIKTQLQPGDQPYYQQVADKLKELAPRDGSPAPTDQRGSLLKWVYFQSGRWAFGVNPWWPVEPKKEVAVLTDAPQATVEAASSAAVTPAVPLWDEQDKRGEAERRTLKWMDATGVDGFVPWTRVDNPDFPGKVVEVGGVKPYAVRPTTGELDAIAAQEAQFVDSVVAMLPRLEFVDVKAEPLGDGVFRVTAKLVNTGVLPTCSEMGEITRVPYPLQISLDLHHNVTLVTGQQRERVPRLLGGGGSIERSWVVRVTGMPLEGHATLLIRADSPSAGHAQAEATMGGGVR